ncbi:MAG TPA: pitrilysin family protein [Daejeonella sp.]|nr:pitrilysin family protein [Daejeonella sp.]
MKKLICFLFLGFSVPLFAQIKADDVKTFTLKNGMKFLVMEDSSIPNANMYLFYKVGSRNEYPGITGLSHFFEHMMFNGSKKFGPKMFDRTMEFNGGANNAYTTQNVTVYTDWFPVSALETMFDLESDRIANLSIDTGMIESERGVVLSERSTSIENSPFNVLSDAVNAAAFQEHPYHWTVIGYETDIKNWTKEDLEQYFRTYYAPNNAVVVISGNVKLDEVKRLAQKYMEPIPGHAPPKPVHLVEPPQEGERRVIVKKEVTTPYMLIGYHTPETKHKDYYALDILSSILSTGNTSRLYSALVDQKQLATSIGTSFDETFDPNLFQIYAITAQNVKEGDLEKAIYDEIEKVKKEGITARELQKIKNQKLMQFYSQIETINGKSNNIGTYELFFGDYKKMFNAPAEYEKVTMDDVKRVANEYFKKSNRTVGILKANVEE